MRYRFGECVLVPDRRELTRGAETVVLAPQAFDLLLYLIRHRARVVSKDELIAAIWDGRAVSDAALTTRVYAARCAIGDSGIEQRYIRTLARRGVRFIGPVEEIEEAAAGGAAVPSGSRMSQGPASRGPSISVLPFRHAPDERGVKAMSHVLTEALRVELTRLRCITVVADLENPESRAEKSGTEENGTVARQLPSTQYCLHGSVQRANGRFRITAELTDVYASVNLWADRYEASARDGIAIPRSFAEAIARSAAAAIVQCERSCALAKRPGDLAAWDCHQLGMWHMSACDSATIGPAQRYFEQAIELDPRFASSYSALAWAQLMAGSIYSNMPVAEACDLARPLILRAAKLDETDCELRARLALLEFLQGDIGAAIQEAASVLSIKPDCASALGVKGAALISTGRRREGRAAIAKFLRLSPNDPAEPVRLTQVAASYYLDGDYAQAARTATQVTQRFPQHPYAFRWLAASLGQLDRIEEADFALRRLQNTWPNSFEMYVAKQPPSYCLAEYGPLLSGLRKVGWGI